MNSAHKPENDDEDPLAWLDDGGIELPDDEDDALPDLSFSDATDTPAPEMAEADSLDWLNENEADSTEALPDDFSSLAENEKKIPLAWIER